MDRRDEGETDTDRASEVSATCRDEERHQRRWVRWAVGLGLVAVVLATVSACAAERMTNDEVQKLIDQKVVDAVEVATQQIAVKRENGESEMITLFIVRRADGSKVLFDWTGESYEPTLDDFRANNDLLDSDDVITVPDDFPDTPRRGEPGSGKPLRLIRVSGHTEATWGWWLGGGAAIAAAGLVLWLRKHRRHVEDIEDVEDEPA